MRSRVRAPSIPLDSFFAVLRANARQIASRSWSAQLHNWRIHNELPSLSRHPLEPTIPQGQVRADRIEGSEPFGGITVPGNASRLRRGLYDRPQRFEPIDALQETFNADQQIDAENLGKAPEGLLLPTRVEAPKSVRDREE